MRSSNMTARLCPDDKGHNQNRKWCGWYPASERIISATEIMVKASAAALCSLVLGFVSIAYLNTSFLCFLLNFIRITFQWSCRGILLPATGVPATQQNLGQSSRGLWCRFIAMSATSPAFVCTCSQRRLQPRCICHKIPNPFFLHWLWFWNMWNCPSSPLNPSLLFLLPSSPPPLSPTPLWGFFE